MSKHPYELNCSRELGHKTKTYPFEPSLLLYFSDSNLLSFQSLSSCLLEFLKNVKLPQTSFLLLFLKFLVIMVFLEGQFFGMVFQACWLFLIKRLVLAQLLELRYMHQHINRDG